MGAWTSCSAGAQNIKRWGAKNIPRYQRRLDYARRRVPVFNHLIAYGIPWISAALFLLDVVRLAMRAHGLEPGARRHVFCCIHGWEDGIAMQMLPLVVARPT